MENNGHKIVKILLDNCSEYSTTAEKDPFYPLGNLGNGTLLFRDTLATSIIRTHLCAISGHEPGTLHCNQADVAQPPLTEEQIGL